MARRVIHRKDLPVLCFTVAEFCVSHRIGLATYYRMREAGLAPHEFRPLGGKKVLITVESATRWRAARDAETIGAADFG